MVKSNLQANHTSCELDRRDVQLHLQIGAH